MVWSVRYLIVIIDICYKVLWTKDNNTHAVDLSVKKKVKILFNKSTGSSEFPQWKGNEVRIRCHTRHMSAVSVLSFTFENHFTGNLALPLSPGNI